MKRIKFNTTWQEDEDEKRQFFASLSYSERLRFYFRLRDMVNFDKKPYPKVKIFRYITHTMLFDVWQGWYYLAERFVNF